MRKLSEHHVYKGEVKRKRKLPLARRSKLLGKTVLGTVELA